MRNPRAPGWPERGERTEDPEIAERWKWAYVDALLAEKKRRLLGRPRDRKLGAVVADYLEHRLNTREAATWRADRTAIQHLLETVGPQASLSALGDSLQGMFDTLLRQGYAPTTLHTYKISLGPFFKWAGHVMPEVALPRPGVVDVPTFDPDQVAALRKSAKEVGKHAVLAVELGLTMGLRQGEIFALRWEAIDRQEESARVQWQLTRGRDEPRPLKGKQARSVYILPEWWRHHRKASGYIIDAMRERARWELIKEVLRGAGLDAFGAGYHRLRHTYAMRYIVEFGGRFEELKTFLGHTSIVVTERTYGHFESSVAVKLARGRVGRVS